MPTPQKGRALSHDGPGGPDLKSTKEGPRKLNIGGKGAHHTGHSWSRLELEKSKVMLIKSQVKVWYGILEFNVPLDTV